MRRISGLFPAFVSFRNLYDAAKKAVRGSSKSQDALEFQFNLEHELLTLERELSEGCYHPGPYHFFTIYEPKERIIAVAPFRDRVVHHALINVLEPVFERIFVFDSYATRKGKGTHAAVIRAQDFIRQNRWYLKCDISRYFHSVDIDILMTRIRRKVKDERILGIVELILYNGASEGQGLPIGNLTSQFFANVYLDVFDHWMKEEIGARYYLRYMDDFVVFNNDKNFLKHLRILTESFLEKNLRLSLKKKACCINSSLNGLGFLGRRIFPSLIRIRKENLCRSLKKIRRNEDLLKKGLIDEAHYGRSMESLLGYIASCDTLTLRKRLWGNAAKRGRTACTAAGALTTMRTTCVYRIATTTRRTIGTTT